MPTSKNSRYDCYQSILNGINTLQVTFNKMKKWPVHLDGPFLNCRGYRKLKFMPAHPHVTMK